MNKTVDRYTSFFFLFIGVSFIVGSRSIAQSSYGSEVGPDIFPFWLGVICSLLSVRLFFESLRAKGEEEQQEKKSLDYKKFAIILGTTTLYCLFLEKIGYVIGTFLFLLIGFQTIDKRKWPLSTLISLAVSVGVYYVYVEILQGTLPGFPSWLSR
ncbi:tripartite tricarboxylate transporter TctB family protein [Brevibacillus composti]|uniref:Tripartite tricarboxylate transporter TctB family protein n=1 Tax=Brevibacillus composti TaxID=2796470 RepID=A0A7T5EKX6_9BACL|nr:tripartite tricarboxylate transporter TctB family protein [Brevibacillus composti]QQE74501.1 tripartite tricarboxylate transporter TctB family protein [Brevibacillus composti]QUO41583.1 tripartite tricarboxylate transporter TctB family protein [Brevibacillus composti]